MSRRLAIIVTILLLSLGLELADAGTCSSCITGGNVYCFTFDRCGMLPVCFKWTNKILNCPELRGKTATYNETFVREKVLVTLAAPFHVNPQRCFENSMPTMEVVNVYRVDSLIFGNSSTLVGYLAVDHTEKAIVFSFRGTEGPIQLMEQILNYYTGTLQFFDVGKMYSYFHDSFLYLWRAGLGKDLTDTHDMHPDYELWATGYSLGGALASVAASYVVKINLFDPINIKLVTFGQPRTGSYQYATWHEQTFPYSFRIVNSRDPVPHVPPLHGPVDLFHHRTEVWYENEMDYASKVHSYKICTEADGDKCSNSLLFYFPTDHLEYFGINLGEWGKKGCPKSIT